MAQKVTVALVDDLDGSVSEDISTVSFGLDGVEYEIDLTEDNAAKLRDTLADFVAAARRTSGRRKRGGARAGSSAARPAADREQTRLIREWARENGYELADRGRIPSNVLAAYEEAQAAPAVRPKTARGRRRTKEPVAS